MILTELEIIIDLSTAPQVPVSDPFVAIDPEAIRDTALQGQPVQGIEDQRPVAFAKKNRPIMEYLPIEKECRKLPRDYLANILVSLKPNEFAAMVTEKMRDRHKLHKEKQNVIVKLSAEIKEKILAS